jgi:chromate transporter
MGGLRLCKKLPLMDDEGNDDRISIPLSKQKALLALLSFFILLFALPLVAVISSRRRLHCSRHSIALAL